MLTTSQNILTHKLFESVEERREIGSSLLDDFTAPLDQILEVIQYASPVQMEVIKQLAGMLGSDEGPEWKRIGVCNQGRYAVESHHLSEAIRLVDTATGAILVDLDPDPDFTRWTLIDEEDNDGNLTGETWIYDGTSPRWLLEA